MGKERGLLWGTEVWVLHMLRRSLSHSRQYWVGSGRVGGVKDDGRTDGRTDGRGPPPLLPFVLYIFLALHRLRLAREHARALAGWCGMPKI